MAGDASDGGGSVRTPAVERGEGSVPLSAGSKALDGAARVFGRGSWLRPTVRRAVTAATLKSKLGDLKASVVKAMPIPGMAAVAAAAPVAEVDVRRAGDDTERYGVVETVDGMPPIPRIEPPGRGVSGAEKGIRDSKQ